MNTANSHLPLVYSCSGCSSAAQMANFLALALDRAGTAEMSCIAGVGGNVPHLVKIAKSGRAILALDGCAAVCVKHCLEQRDVTPTEHIQLQHLGVKKRYSSDFDAEVAATILLQLKEVSQKLVHNSSQSSMVLP